MVDLAMLQVVRDLVAIFGVVAGFTYYVMIVRNANRTRELSLKSQDQALETRQAQMFMQIFDKFHEPEFFNKFTRIFTWTWTDYDDFIDKYGWEADPEAWYSEGSVAAFFEGIGLLVHLELLDLKLVHGLMFRHVKMFWEKMRPISLEMRKRLRIPHIDQWVEYLYAELMRYDKEMLMA